MTFRKINYICFLFFAFFPLWGKCETLAVYEKRNIGEPMVHDINFFYSHGEFGDSSYSAGGMWGGKIDLKYCKNDSAWVCVIGAITLAFPKDSNVKSWCFGGYRFFRSHITSTRFSIKGVNKYFHNGNWYAENNEFLYDEKIGIKVFSDGISEFNLISRDGLLGDEFMDGIGAPLKKKELNYLLSLCELNPSSSVIEKHIFKREKVISQRNK